MMLLLYLFCPFVILLMISDSSWADTHVILQKNKQFSTNSIKIKIGDTLVFKNGETDITHNVYSITTGNEFELKVQKPGTSSPVLINSEKHQAGEMLVECAIHPHMKLKVKIEK